MQISKQYILHDKNEASHLLKITINSLKSAFRPRPRELRAQGQNIPKLSMDRMDTLAAKLANAPGSNILTKVKHITTAMAGVFPSFVRGLVFSRFSKDENSECEKSILVFVLDLSTMSVAHA